MIMFRAKILGLLLMALVVGACTPDIAVPATVPPTRTVRATETGTAVAQPPPTTPTATFTMIPKATQIPLSQTFPRDESVSVPTVTLRPTLTPQIAVTTEPNYYDIPAWVSDPEVNVLLFNQDFKATLFNPQTGELYDIPVEGSPSLRWVQHEDGLYVRLGYPVAWDATTWSAEEINIATGQINRLEGPRELTPTPHIPSPDGRHEARIVRTEGTPDIVYIVDQVSGEKTELANPYDNQYFLINDIEWSPDGQLLAIERTQSIEDPDAFMGRRTMSASTVYSVNGINLSQNVGVTGQGIEWSSTSPYNLLHPKYGLNTDSPCIFDSNTTSFTCLDQIVVWRDRREVETYNYKWSPDGRKIGFIYWTETSKSGFCYIDLTSIGIICPINTEDFQKDVFLDQFSLYGTPHLLYVKAYDWSPDGNYVILEIDPASPSSDDATLRGVAVINDAGEVLQIFTEGRWYNYPWRPAIPFQPEE